MDGFIIKLLLALVYIGIVPQSARAMKGLCSTDWFDVTGCFDIGDECKTMGGACRHDNYGDHGEGCACVKAVVRANRPEYEILTKNHLQVMEYSTKDHSQVRGNTTENHIQVKGNTTNDHLQVNGNTTGNPILINGNTTKGNLQVKGNLTKGNFKVNRNSTTGHSSGQGQLDRGKLSVQGKFFYSCTMKGIMKPKTIHAISKLHHFQRFHVPRKSLIINRNNTRV
ncbi:hypothetical protein DPMN_022685 [Dreissena polymorpha]|uniref:Uncharacterized protein n=1 Tax=Dreissena polymorpha TaxID=45954 RepID=A0A9D4SBW2_DREPO|nr:hypothetical protein DPMN_022685 [Dreissena polymorpha]